MLTGDDKSYHRLLPSSLSGNPDRAVDYIKGEAEGERFLKQPNT